MGWLVDLRGVDAQDLKCAINNLHDDKGDAAIEGRNPEYPAALEFGEEGGEGAQGASSYRLPGMSGGGISTE